MSNNIFAKALANSYDKEQAEFLNEFCRLLKLACKDREAHQLCYVADYLEPQAADTLKELYEFSKLAQENRARLTQDINDLRNEKYKLQNEVNELKQKSTEEIPF